MVFSVGTALWETAKAAVKKLFSRNASDDSIKFENYRRMNQQLDDQFTNPSSIQSAEPLKTDEYVSKINSIGSATLGEPTTSSLLDAIKDSNKIHIEALNDTYSNLSSKLDSIDSRIDVVNQNIQTSIQATQSYGVSNLEASRQIGTKKSLLGSIWNAVTSLPGKILTTIGTVGYLGYKAVEAISDYAAVVQTQKKTPLPETDKILEALENNPEYQKVQETGKMLDESIAALRKAGVQSSKELTKSVSNINKMVSSAESSEPESAANTIVGWLKTSEIEDEERKALQELLGDEATSDKLKSSDPDVKLALLNALRIANSMPSVSLDSVIKHTGASKRYSKNIKGSNEWSYLNYAQTSELDKLLMSKDVNLELDNSIRLVEGAKNIDVNSIKSSIISSSNEDINETMTLLFGEDNWVPDSGFNVSEEVLEAMRTYLKDHPDEGIMYLLKDTYSNYNPESGTGVLKNNLNYLDLYPVSRNLSAVEDYYEAISEEAPKAWEHFKKARDRVNADLINKWQTSVETSGRDYKITWTGDNLKDSEKIAKAIERGLIKYENPEQRITTESDYQDLLKMTNRLSQNTNARLTPKSFATKYDTIDTFRKSLLAGDQSPIKTPSDLAKLYKITLSDGTEIINGKDVTGILDLMSEDDTLSLDEAVSKYRSINSPEYLASLLTEISNEGFKLKKISGLGITLSGDATVTDFSDFSSLEDLSRHLDLTSPEGIEIKDNNEVLNLLQKFISEDNIISNTLALSTVRTVIENKGLLERIDNKLSGPSQQVKSIEEPK